MSFTYSEKFDVPFPVEQVFLFATDIDKRAKWQMHLKSVTKLTDGPVATGTRFEENGASGKMILIFTEFEKNKRIRYVSENGKGINVDVFWNFSDHGNSTTIEATVNLQPKGIMKLFWPVMKSFLIAPQVRKDFKYLREKLSALNEE